MPCVEALCCNLPCFVFFVVVVVFFFCNWICFQIKTVKFLKDDFFQSVTQAYSEKENPSAPNGRRAYDLLISTLDAL